MAGESQQIPEGKADPTVLTTEQLERAIGNLKDLLLAQMDGLRKELAADKALCDEQLRSVATQFALVERQRVEQKQDTKAAVDAALAAAKEAVKEQTTASGLAIAKSETGFKEQLGQQSVTHTTAISGVSTTVSDLKTRVERIENVKQGGQEFRSQAQAGWGVAIAAAGLVLALLATAVTIILATR